MMWVWRSPPSTTRWPLRTTPSTAAATTREESEDALARVPKRMRRADIPELDEMADTVREKVDMQGTFNALAVRGLGAE